MAKLRKVFIAADIEGMEGVVSGMSITRGKMDFPIGRKRLALDVNAAIEAAFDAGAEEVVVCDGHADMENIIIEDLDERAKLISGAMRSSLQMQTIERGYDAFIMFGHSGAGETFGGVIDHCYNGRKIYNVRLNGVTMNTEAVQNAVIAGHYGTPLVAIIGDEAVCQEVKKFVPNCEGIAVKEGLGRFCAMSVHPNKARKMIYEGVTRALKRLEEIKPLKIAEPITMEIDFKDSNMAEVCELIPGVKRINPRSITVTGDAETIFKLHELMIFRLVDNMA